jgi:putative addiction module component (TIGR02574 family)
MEVPVTKAALSKSLRKLPVMERLELIDELWHSVAADRDQIPVPDWQKEMIDASLAEVEARPDRGLTLEEFQRRIDRTIQKMEGRRRKKTA